MDILLPLWGLIQVLIGYNLVVPLLLFFLWLVIRKKRTSIIPPSEESDFAIIVTAYEQTDSLHAVVRSILSLNYNRYLVYVVADNCDISQLNFSDERVIVLRPEKTLASNTRSHFYAIDHFRRNHPNLTIIDSDNLVHPDYLQNLDVLFRQGFVAVQGVRAAKNLNSTIACLDAARDLYYHFYDGKLLFECGSSATLAGSGMAFTTELYRTCLEDRNVEGAGFDKVLQAEILKRNIRIAFAPDAIVYDEKTAASDQLVNQRSRWIYTWFRYFTLGFSILKKGIINRSLNQLLFATILLRPPLFIFLLSSVVCLLADVIIQPAAVIFWLAGIIAFIAGFILALKYSKADILIYRSLWNIPSFVYFQIKALLRSGRRNKGTVATKHFYNSEIGDIKRKEQ